MNENRIHSPAHLYFSHLLIAIMLVFTLPVPMVSADTGIPMLIVSLPLMILLLLPVTIIEAKVLQKRFNIHFKRAFLSFGTANIISTLLGFPLAWFLLLIYEGIVGGGSCGPGFDSLGDGFITVLIEVAWLCIHSEQLIWMVSVAFMLSLLLAFLFSLILEYSVLRQLFPTTDQTIIRRTVVIANCYSYLFLIVVNILYLLAYGWW